MMRSLTLLFVLMGVVISGCLEGGIVSVGGPVRLSLTVEKAEAPQGTPHVFKMEAQGQQLLGLILDYGDGQVDSIPTAGAQTATHIEAYIYDKAGEYLVRARVEDQNGRSAQDSVMVSVLPSP
jgi:hypothetical protein